MPLHHKSAADRLPPPASRPRARASARSRAWRGRARAAHRASWLALAPARRLPPPVLLPFTTLPIFPWTPRLPRRIEGTGQSSRGPTPAAGHLGRGRQRSPADCPPGVALRRFPAVRPCPTAGPVRTPTFATLAQSQAVSSQNPRAAPGCSAAWLARLLWEQEAAGSNPAIPTAIFRMYCQSSVNHPGRRHCAREVGRHKT